MQIVGAIFAHGQGGGAKFLLYKGLEKLRPTDFLECGTRNAERTATATTTARPFDSLRSLGVTEAIAGTLATGDNICDH